MKQFDHVRTKDALNTLSKTSQQIQFVLSARADLLKSECKQVSGFCRQCETADLLADLSKNIQTIRNDHWGIVQFMDAQEIKDFLSGPLYRRAADVDGIDGRKKVVLLKTKINGERKVLHEDQGGDELLDASKEPGNALQAEARAVAHAALAKAQSEVSCE